MSLRETVNKAILKMKSRKTASVMEPVQGYRFITNLINAIIRSGRVPSESNESQIKGKGDALERGNYRGLKLLDHKDMQFGFITGWDTTGTRKI